MRILYVEDNPANIFLVKRVAQGHQVVNYIDGEEAIKNFDRDQPDLVLMDIQLAGPMNGLDAVRMLRSRGVTTPIIAVTAYAMVGDRERCLAAGCDDYLAKPLPIPHLLALLEKYKAQTTEQPIVLLEALPKSTQTLAPVVTPTSTPEAPPVPLASLDKLPTSPTSIEKSAQEVLSTDVPDPKVNGEVESLTPEPSATLVVESAGNDLPASEINGGAKPPENRATLIETNS